MAVEGLSWLVGVVFFPEISSDRDVCLSEDFCRRREEEEQEVRSQ